MPTSLAPGPAESKKTRSPARMSPRATAVPTLNWSKLVRGIEIPASLNAHEVNPEQSKPPGCAPPELYGVPSWAFAALTARCAAPSATAGRSRGAGSPACPACAAVRLIFMRRRTSRSARPSARSPARCSQRRSARRVDCPNAPSTRTRTLRCRRRVCSRVRRSTGSADFDEASAAPSGPLAPVEPLVAVVGGEFSGAACWAAAGTTAKATSASAAATVAGRRRSGAAALGRGWGRRELLELGDDAYGVS